MSRFIVDDLSDKTKLDIDIMVNNIIGKFKEDNNIPLNEPLNYFDCVDLGKYLKCLIIKKEVDKAK